MATRMNWKPKLGETAVMPKEEPSFVGFICGIFTHKGLDD